MTGKGKRANAGACVVALLWLVAPACAGPSPSSSPVAAAAREAAPIAVSTVRPRRQEVLLRVEVPASLEAFETTTLFSKVTGYLQEIRVDIGDRVKKGEVLAKLVIPEMEERLRSSRAELEGVRARRQQTLGQLQAARATLRLRRQTFKRISSVREAGPDLMAEQKVDEAREQLQVARARVKEMEGRLGEMESRIEAATAQVRRLETLMAYSEIRAPFSGVVTRRFVDRGALIRAGTSSSQAGPLLSVARIDRLRVRVEVPEKVVPYVSRGDRAWVVFDALPGKRYPGRVARSSSFLSSSSRTMKIEIDLAGGPGLLPGLYGHVDLILERHPGALTIPAEALRKEGGQAFVYRVEQGRARKVKVLPGIDDAVRVEILQGLTGEEDVIVTSRADLREGARVEASSGRQEG